MDDPILRNAARMRLVYNEETIARRVRELAAEIDALYGDEPLVIICVLKGAFMFFSDLVKNLTISPELDFVRLASYGHKTAGAATWRLPRMWRFHCRASMCWWWRISWTADTRWIFAPATGYARRAQFTFGGTVG